MKRQKAEPKKTEATAFSFGDPEPVLQGGIYEYVGIWLLDNGRYYILSVYVVQFNAYTLDHLHKHLSHGAKSLASMAYGILLLGSKLCRRAAVLI